MKKLDLNKMESLTAGFEPTCGNSFFMAFSGLGVIASAIAGNDLGSYHTKLAQCLKDS